MSPTGDQYPGTEFRVGLLGSPDSTTTIALVRELRNHGVVPDFIVYWRPRFRENFARTRFMFRKHGFLAVAEALTWGVLSKVHRPGRRSPRGEAAPRVYFVPHHNSAECERVLAEECPDVLILSTSVIIRKAVYSAARLATLNAHPAWLPQYRGMGSSHYQLADGYHLAVSVHAVDDGIDSGPIYAREVIELDLSNGVHELRRQLFGIKPDVHRLMGKLLRRVIDDFRGGRARAIDCADEPSRLFKGGMAKRELRQLDLRLRDPRCELRRIDFARHGCGG